MAPGVQVILSGTITFGVPVLCAVRELILLRRPRNDRGGPGPEPSPPDRDPDAPSLPACLVPQPRARQPARTPELV